MPPLTLDRRRFLGMTAGAAVATALGPGCGGSPSAPPPKGPGPIRDLSGIRGFNYTPSTAFHDIGFWRDYDESLVERELDLARRLNLNSARVFLHYVVYEHDKAAFLGRVRHFVRAAHARAISTLPVVWDSCFNESVAR